MVDNLLVRTIELSIFSLKTRVLPALCQVTFIYKPVYAYVTRPFFFGKAQKKLCVA